jgi:large subunit ribosomal protein L6
MSRIGKLPIAVPEGVDVELQGSRFAAKGKLGELQVDLHPEMKVTIADGVISVVRPTEQTRHRALHGLTRTLVANAVEGVSKGFSRDLELVGVGYRAVKQGNDLQLSLGFSHPVKYSPPPGINIECPDQVKIRISGADKELVGRVTAEIRKFRPPEPYKGKGILYKGERVKRKAGKSGKATATA